ncbi:ROK family protein [Limimaricola cinnabarinus]|uniref:Uncharacterized protein n=1 Tax=Limimaricola cinnabarinus LL-001 TaxID=1337093 RepID=U3AG58_9RHOB|nr:ROK family protein [Limimaricola cinnabarinus]GAD56679.1 hypothetical protein MBELCI_2731 [Limimaricola cinnabarinus LL-001]
MIGPEGDRLSSANIPCIHGRALARELTERLGLPVDVINDANAFGLAESVLAAARATAWSSPPSSAPASAARW